MITSPKNHQKTTRGLAARGSLFRFSSSGVWASKVCINGKIHYLRCGAEYQCAQVLDAEARRRLRTGEPIESVKLWAAAAARELDQPRRPNTSDAGSVEPGARVTIHPPPQVPRNFDAALDANSAPPEKATAAPATIGDFIRAAFRSLDLPEAPKEKTVHRYAASLLNAVELVHFHLRGATDEKPNRSGRRVGFDAYRIKSDGAWVRVIDQPLTILVPDVIASFQDARLELARKSGRPERSAKISANTEVKQMRSLFDTAWARRVFKKHGLQKPSCIHGFCVDHPLFRIVKKAPVVFTDGEVRKLQAVIRSLVREGDRAVVMVLALAFYAGLRKQEIMNAKRTWITSDATGNFIAVQATEKFRPKFGKDRNVLLKQSWLPEWLLEGSDKRYLVADDPAERARAIERAYEVICDLGIVRKKPLHALRALFASYLRAVYPDVSRVTAILGHNDIRCTSNYYSPHPVAKHLIPAWHVPLPSWRPSLTQLEFDVAA